MRDFTFLVPHGAFGTGVAASLDILRAASLLAPRAKAATPAWKVCSVAGGHVPLQTGLLMPTEALPVDDDSDLSTWVIPGLGANTPDALKALLAQADSKALVSAIQAHVQRGGKVAASCTSVFLLAEAGLLNGRKATTTWWLAPTFKAFYPKVALDASCMVIKDGPFITAGAALAQTDLMLFLLREQFGPALADNTARYLLMDARQAQSQYVMPEVLAMGDQLIKHIVEKVEGALPHVPSVSELAQHFCMHERTLGRHVRAVSGVSTLSLIQQVRVRRARQLLETSKLSIEQIASQVGYEDATALRRLIKRTLGARPNQYRAQKSSPHVVGNGRKAVQPDT